MLKQWRTQDFAIGHRRQEGNEAMKGDSSSQQVPPH